MTEAIKLPAPEMWLLTKHDEYSFSHLIAKYIRFYKVDEDTGLERNVALDMQWVKHVLNYRDSKMPVCTAICTAPIVLRDGTLLATHGLDRKRGILFILQPELLAVLPQPAGCGDDAVREAIRFLMDEWLVDVRGESLAAKYVAIAAALSIVERTILPERPAFFVTAGKRGGGKTTLLNMIVTAVTGHVMPAAEWSSNADERRKALLAYLREGTPVVCWDNIVKGSLISCPHIEKSLTNLLYTGRVLTTSDTATVPATTTVFFTGNNILPKGDMASRSIVIRLKVDQYDPENRPVMHEDAVVWTIKHRGNILRALYTILLGNPRLRAEKRGPAETRFKTWWHIVGAAVEHAAVLYGTTISFKSLLAANEEGNEQEIALARLLRSLKNEFPNGFAASLLSERVNESFEWKDILEQASDRTLNDVTPQKVSRALKAVCDAPCLVTLDLSGGKKKDAPDKREMVLKFDPTTTHHESGSFKVEVHAPKQ